MNTEGYEIIKTACPRNCYDTCGVHIYVKNGVAVKVEGDPDHPVTRGHLCLKTKAILHRTYSPDRVKYPLKRVGARGEGKFTRISWDEAWDTLVKRLTEVRDKYGSEAVMEYKYSGSHEMLGKAIGQRFLNLFGATNLVGTICNSNGFSGYEYTIGPRLCQDPLVWSEAAECAIVWGRRVEAADVHIAPFLFRVKDRGGKLIVVDPLVSNIASKADIHLRPRPGTDTALAYGLMNHMVTEGIYDKAFVDQNTHGFDKLREEIEKWPVSRAAQVTEVPEAEIKEVARIYASHKSMLISGYAPQRYSNGFQTQRAISCLAALSGHFGRPGEHYEYNTGFCGPIMAGMAEVQKPKGADIKRRREIVIGMANIAMLEAKDPPIKAVINWRGGFVTQQPNSNLAIKALQGLDFFVVFDQFLTDDTDYADLVIPACTFIEQYGFKNPIWHPYLQVQYPAVRPAYEAITDIDFWCELGRRLGYEEYFPKDRTPEDWLRMFILPEIDLKAMMHPHGPLRAPEKFCPKVPYESFKFKTPTGKIELCSTMLEKFSKKGKDAEPVPVFKEPEDSPFEEGGSSAYPFVLLTPHPVTATSTQGQNLPWIKELEKPSVFIHPHDAAAKGIKDGERVRMFNDFGEARSWAQVTRKVKPGMLCTWSGKWIKLGGAVNFLIKNTMGGPRDVGNGIINVDEPAFNMLEDGGSPGYYGCYVQIESVK